jgi:hypothetical protein
MSASHFDETSSPMPLATGGRASIMAQTSVTDGVTPSVPAAPQNEKIVRYRIWRPANHTLIRLRTG